MYRSRLSYPVAGKSLSLMSLFLAGKDLENKQALCALAEPNVLLTLILRLNNIWLSKVVLCERGVNNEGRICCL